MVTDESDRIPLKSDLPGIHQTNSIAAWQLFKIFFFFAVFSPSLLVKNTSLSTA